MKFGKYPIHFRSNIRWKKIFKKFLLHQKLRLEISGGPLGVKKSILAHLVVENPEKHTFGQNCPKYDATVKMPFDLIPVRFSYE